MENRNKKVEEALKLSLKSRVAVKNMLLLKAFGAAAEEASKGYIEHEKEVDRLLSELGMDPVDPTFS